MTLEIASVVVALLAVAAAVTYYTYTLRAQTRLRKANLLMGLYAKLDTLEFQESWHRIFWMEYVDYDDAIEKLGGRHVGSFVFYFYDEVGVLLRHKLIDDALAYDLFGNSLFQMWEKVAPIIGEARRRADDPTIYENWEYVYERLRRRHGSAGQRPGGGAGARVADVPTQEPQRSQEPYAEERRARAG
jgi:hypothetical protein